MAKLDKMEEDAPKNPFAGMLGGGDDEEESESDEDDGDYEVTPEEVALGKEAMDAKTPEEFTKAICMLIKTHTGG